MENRFDVRNVLYQQTNKSKKASKATLGSLTSEEPCYGTSATAKVRTDDNQPKYIRITDFDDFGIDENHEYMTTDQYASKHVLKPGDILFARTGATVGKTYYYDGSIGKAVFAGYCIRFRFDEKKVFPKYIYWYTKTSAFLNWVKGIQRPSGQPNINKEEYKSFEIVLPDYEAQKQLSRDLNTAVQKRNELHTRANKLLSDLPVLLMRSLGLAFDFKTTCLVYAVRLKDIHGRIDADFYSPKFVSFRRQIENGKFPAVSIGSIASSITTGFAAGKQDQADELPDEERVTQLRPFSITPEGELSFETQKYVPKNRVKNSDYCQKNEVIFNNTNSPDLVGKTTVFDSDVLCTTSNHMTRITIKDGVNPYYVSYFFNLLLSIGYWKLLCTNFNNQAGVNIETLKSVKIPLPDIETQNAIVAKIMGRRSEANRLRKEAEQEWREAKKQFEKELLGEK